MFQISYPIVMLLAITLAFTGFGMVSSSPPASLAPAQQENLFIGTFSGEDPEGNHGAIIISADSIIVRDDDSENEMTGSYYIDGDTLIADVEGSELTATLSKDGDIIIDTEWIEPTLFPRQ